MVAAGGVVALPFERLFGLAAKALDPSAVDSIVRIKKRPATPAGVQPISVIISRVEQIHEVANQVPPVARDLIAQYWPGPLTLLLPAKPGLPEPLVGPGGRIGVRIPGPCPALTLAEHLGLVLTATSANLSGQTDALTSEDLGDLIGVDAIVKGGVAGPPGSTVVDATGSRPVVIREGCLKLERVGH